MAMNFMNLFKGKETAKKEKAEEKLTSKQYAKGEKMEGTKSTSAKKPMGTAAAKKMAPAKKVVAAKKMVAAKKK